MQSFLATILLSVYLFSCDAETSSDELDDTETAETNSENDTESTTEEEQTESEQNSEETTEQVGTLQISGCSSKVDCGEKVTQALSVSATHIESVTNTTSPGALALGTSAGLSGEQEPDISGCFSNYGPGECQKTAIQFYLWLAKQPMLVAKNIIKGVSQLFKTLLTSDKGTFEAEDGTKVEYQIVSTTQFEVLLLSTDGTRIYLNHKAVGDYEVRYYGPNGAGSDIVQYLNADILYETETNWSNQIYTVDNKCSDGGTPPLSIKIDKTEGLWKGKAMVYTYKDQSTCEVNTNGDAGFYTDFVGDDSYVTGAMYFFPVDLDLTQLRTDQLPNYDLNDICDNIPEHEFQSFLCDGRVSLPDLTNANEESFASCDSSNSTYYQPSLASACSTCLSSVQSGSPNEEACKQIPSFRWFYMQTYYPNNYCILPSTSILTALKNDDPSDSDFSRNCADSDVPDIKNGVFSNAGDWINPVELRDLTYQDFYCSPVSLEEKETCF